MATPRPPHGIFESVESKTLGLTQGLLVASLILLLLLLLGGVYLVWRKRQKRSVISPQNPWDELRSDIATSSNGPSSKQMASLSLALRKGLEIRTGRPFQALTSGEVIQELKRDDQFSSDFQTECAEFVRTSDRVLYALETCDDESLSRWNRQIVAWLESLQVGRPL